MNLVHKVGVIFHGTDRLSKHMEKIGHQLAGLDGKYKAMGKAHAASDAQMSRLAKANQKHISGQAAEVNKYQRSLVNLSKKQEQLSNMARKNQMAGQRMWDAYYKKIGDLDQQRTDREATQARARRDLAERNRTALQAVDERYQKHRQRMENQQTALENRRRKVIRGGGRTLDASEVAQSIARQQHLHRLIESQRQAAAEAGRKALLTDKGKPRRVKGDDGKLRAMTAAEEAQVVAAAAKRPNKIAGELTKQLAGEKARIAASHELTSILEKQRAISAREAALAQEQGLRMSALVDKQLRAANELETAQRHLNELKDRGAQEEIANAERVFQEKTRQMDRLEQLKMEEIALNRRAHNELIAQIGAEDQARRRQLHMEEGVDRVQRRLDGRKVTDEQNQEIFHRTRDGLRGGLRNVASWGAGRMHAAGGSLGGAAMMLGGLGYGGNHLVEASLENEHLRDALYLNVYGQKNEQGKLWSDVMVDKVNGAGGRIPGTDQRMSRNALLDIFKEQLSAEVAPEHAVHNMPLMAKTLRAFELKGKDTKGMSQDISTIFERLGAMTPEQTGAISDALVKSANTSGRGTPKAMRDIFLKSSISMRALGMREKQLTASFSFFDYLLGATPSGAQVATQTAGFLENFMKGGANESSNAMISAISKKHGLWGMTDGIPVIDKKTGKQKINGKNQPMWLQRPAPILKQETLDGGAGALSLLITKGARLMGKVDEKRFLTDKLTGKESTTYMQNLQTIAGQKFGGRQLMQIGNITEQKRFGVADTKFKAAPGTDETLSIQKNRYGKEFLSMQASWADFAETLGEALRGPLSQFLKDVTFWLDKAAKFLKTDDGKKFVEWTVSATKYLGALMLINGALLGLPTGIAKAIGMGIVQGVTTAIASAAVTGGLSTGLAWLFGASATSAAATAALSGGFATSFGTAMAAPAVTTAASGGLAGIFARSLALGGPVALAIAAGLAAAFAAYKVAEGVGTHPGAPFYEGNTLKAAAKEAAMVGSMARGEPGTISEAEKSALRSHALGGKGSSVLPDRGAAMPTTVTVQHTPQQHTHNVNVRVTGDGVSAEKAAAKIAPVIADKIQRAYQGGGAITPRPGVPVQR